MEGETPASGAVHRLTPDGDVQVVAEGLRNPYGLALDEDRMMYATNPGYDDRGVRAVKDSPDWLVAVFEGAWYGWPDYAGTEPLTAERFASERGESRRPLIENPPEVTPPVTSFPPHFSPMKMCLAPAAFGLGDRLMIVIFGDAAPLTSDLDESVATGVVTLNRLSGEYEWFAKDRQQPRYTAERAGVQTDNRCQTGCRRQQLVHPGFWSHGFYRYGSKRHT